MLGPNSSLRRDFPIFAAHPDLVYLDSAASAQKPRAVIEAVTEFYRSGYSNIHRGAYPLAESATAAFEAARETLARFLGAQPEELVFTRSATESLNLLAATLPQAQNWLAGENLVLSEDAHHANLLPWQRVAQERGLEMRFVKSTPAGDTDLQNLAELVDAKTRAVALTHCSNVFGTILPAGEIAPLLRQKGSGAVFVLDACQSLPHLPSSTANLGCDFLVGSGHKLYGPSGIGFLWGRKELLATLPPYQLGGEMVRTATLESATWNDAPLRFEAGTPNIEGAVGLDAALRFLESIGMENVAEHSSELSLHARDRLEELPGIKILGEPDPRSGIISFTAKDAHPHDIATLLGEREVCIRAGHHCAMPLHQRLGIPASCRISFGIYSEEQDVDRMARALAEVLKEIRGA
jgi:cysteine desulfurase/selenocysteine lyase